MMLPVLAKRIFNQLYECISLVWYAFHNIGRWLPTNIKLEIIPAISG